MLALIREGWDLMRHAVETAPLGFWPLIAANLIAWGVMNRLRYWLPHRWRQRRREATAQGVSFLAGVWITLTLWPTKPGFVAGIAVGLWAPFSYWCATKVFGVIAARFQRKFGTLPPP